MDKEKILAKARIANRKYYQENKDIINAKRKGQYQTYKVRIKKHYEKNREHICKVAREYNKRIRLEVLEHYGNKCACCGITEYEFLAIDHIKGGGIKHRKEIGNAGNSIAKWLKKNNYPEGFRILCHNCNLALGIHGHCPHNNL